MRKTLPFTLLLTGLALLIASCASRAPSAPPATQTPAPTQTSTASADTGHCTVSSLNATVEPTTASLFPPAGASDWSKGPENATVTFIEYGDFM